MIQSVRKLFAVVAVVALLGPATLALCAAGAVPHCEAAMVSHSCCDGPRLSDCRCDESDASGRQSEPAKRATRLTADNTPTAVVFEYAQPVVSCSRTVWLEASPPPRAAGERLSLLSTLLV